MTWRPAWSGLGERVGDHVNYVFYETDPGVAPADVLEMATSPDRGAKLPEWAWWEFDTLIG